MTIVDTSPSFELFRREAPPEYVQLVEMMSAAPSVTFETALYFADPVFGGGPKAVHAVNSILRSEFVAAVGAEFRLHPAIRSDVAAGSSRENLLKGGLRLHGLYRRWRDKAGSSTSDDIAGVIDLSAGGVARLPKYFQYQAAYPFHLAYVDGDEALPAYLASFHKDTSYVGRYILGRWSFLQQELRILNQDAYEPRFLFGMSLYSEGELNEALALLQPVADLPERWVEVAIACHIVANIAMRRKVDLDTRAYLDKSIQISQSGYSEPYRTNLAHTLHTLARYRMEKERNQLKQAQSELEQSLELRRILNDKYGESAVELSLARVFEAQNSERADRHYRDAIRLKRKSGTTQGLQLH